MLRTSLYRYVILHLISGLGSITPSTSYIQEQGRASPVTYDVFLIREQYLHAYTYYVSTVLLWYGALDNRNSYVDALTVLMCVDCVDSVNRRPS